MNIKNVIFLPLVFMLASVHGICNRPDRAHVDTSVVRCCYLQEDIYRCYSKKTGCYKNCERRKECFYCGCPIEDHTKLKTKKKKKVECKR